MKKRFIPVAVAAAVLIVTGIAAVSWVEKNKSNLVEHYTKKNTGTDLTNSDGMAEPDSGLITDGVAELVYDDPVINTEIKHTFLAYDFVDGTEITAQTKYPDDYFCCAFSDDGSPQPTTPGRYIDYERLQEAEPELYEAVLGDLYDGTYSEKEIEDIWERYAAAEEKYSTFSDYGISYVFLQCRFENTTGSEKALNVNNMCGMVNRENVFGLQLCYFDKPQQTDNSYFVYVLQPYETLECVIGVAYYNINIKDTSAPALDELYFGYFDYALYDAYCEGTSPYSPVYGKYVFKVSQLKEMED